MYTRMIGIAATALVAGLGVMGIAAPAQADPATELPLQACNDGTWRAYNTASENSNSPVLPHGNHGCHVHLPY